MNFFYQGIISNINTSCKELFQVAQMIKSLPEMQEAWVRSLSWGDSLEKEIATHSNILAWEIPWTEEPFVLQFMGWQKIWTQLSV